VQIITGGGGCTGRDGSLPECGARMVRTMPGDDLRDRLEEETIHNGKACGVMMSGG